MTAMTDVAKEYGAALFMLACEESATEEYGKALSNIKKAFDEDPEYLIFLDSPNISLGERLAAIEAVFAKTAPEHLVSYLMLLCEKGRIQCFMAAAEEYFALLDASRRRSNAKVVSAVELSEEEKSSIKAKLESIYKGEVNMEYSVDGAILGGLIVEINGKIMDGSLRHRLREVKEVISK